MYDVSLHHDGAVQLPDTERPETVDRDGDDAHILCNVVSASQLAEGQFHIAGGDGKQLAGSVYAKPSHGESDAGSFLAAIYDCRQLDSG